jgi:ubiquilin
MSLKLVIRQSNGDQFEVEVESAAASVAELKKACESGAQLPPDQQRLIFKGRILKDEQTLESYKIENGVTVHLVKAKAATADPSQPQ